MARLKKIDFKKNRLIAKTAPKSPITEQYRTIRTNIQFSAVDIPIRSLMVTSSGPGEGKSTTVSNLAVVFAQQGKKVLLIDSDLRRPTLHFTFGFTNTIGLTNALTRQIHLNESIRKTDVENLYFMPSGPIPPNPAELLGSAAMDQLIADLYEMFDLILFDVPPVLAVADAQVMANQVDAAILVVSSGMTNKEAAIKAKEILEQTKSKLLGAVLNNKEEDRSTYYYYYYSHK